MRGFFYPIFMLGLLGLCIYWAYRTGAEVRKAVHHLEQLTWEIEQEEEQIMILSTEWAYLNRGDRLAALIEQYHDRLLLEPVIPPQIGVLPEDPGGKPTVTERDP